MAGSWTKERVLALAPDAASAKAGQDLGSPRKWVRLGHDGGRAIWGECQGSGSQPYQTRIDLDEPAFKCSCPSRKFPCKHGLGLFLLFALNLPLLTEKEPPGWVSEWLATRAQKAEKKAEKAEAAAQKQADPEEQAKRAAKRLGRVAKGVEDCRLWLNDLVRQGLVDLPSRPYDFWEGMAARMVDAQAPGLASMIGSMGGLANSGEGWTGRLLERMARLHLLLEGFSRLDALSAPLQEDVRSHIGFTQSKEDSLAAGNTAAGPWRVLGVGIDLNERLTEHRAWLRQLGADRRDALVLSFSYAAAPSAPDVTSIAGATVDGPLFYHPSAMPLRAFPAAPLAELATGGQIPSGFGALREAHASWAAALAQNPFLLRAPWLVNDTRLAIVDERLILCDAERRWVPAVVAGEGRLWDALAFTGGHPATVFGEWSGSQLNVLTIWDGQGEVFRA